MALSRELEEGRGRILIQDEKERQGLRQRGAWIPP